MTYVCAFVLWLSLLQNCCKSAARMLDSRFAARLPARPRPRFKIIAARLLHGCCKACYRACCKIVARVLQECLIQGLLQACCKIARPPAALLQDDCCKIVARLLQECCNVCFKACCESAARLATRLLQECSKVAARLDARLTGQLLEFSCSFWELAAH